MKWIQYTHFITLQILICYFLAMCAGIYFCFLTLLNLFNIMIIITIFIAVMLCTIAFTLQRLT